MALIKAGSINDFSVQKLIPEKGIDLSAVKTFAALNEVTKQTPHDAFKLTTSEDKRGIAIKNIKLTEGFEGFLGGVNELYFIAYSWDISGQPVIQYPYAGTDPASTLIPIRVGKVRQGGREGQIQRTGL